MRPLVVVSGFVCGVWAAASPARAQLKWEKNEYQLQKEQIARYEPAPLVAPRVRAAGPVEVLRIRFHADADYRSAAARWQDRIRAQLADLNAVVEPAFGVRFEAESFRRWERASAGAGLEPMLVELERMDRGEDVDWVVGLVSALPLVSMSFHELGRAPLFGRHFVLRGMSSLAEMEAFDKYFGALDRADREKLYGRRKAHKEMAVFLHEWAHTLGAFHVENPTRIMGPEYSQRTSAFSDQDAGLLAAGLAARVGSRERGLSTVDWSALRDFARANNDPEWRSDERQALIARADALVAALPTGVAAAPGRAPAPASDLPPPPTLPGFSRPSGLPGVPPRPGAAPPVARPAQTSSAAEARALLDDHQRMQALPAIRRAADEAERLQPPDSGRFVAVARLYAEAGALTAAEQALARAGEGQLLHAAAADLLRARRRLGLPGGASAFRLAPEAEPEYAELVEGARRLVNAGQLDAAQGAADRGLKRFAGAPGFHLVACEVLMRQEKPRQAAKRCAEALAVMEDLPRAHYLLGCIQAETGQPERGILSLKRSLELDGSDRTVWESLAQLYRALGRHKEFAKFAADYETRPK